MIPVRRVFVDARAVCADYPIRAAKRDPAIGGAMAGPVAVPRNKLNTWRIVVGVSALAILAGCSAPASHVEAATRSSAAQPSMAPTTAASPRTSAAPVVATSSAPKPKAAVLPLTADTVLAGNADPTYKAGDPGILAILDRGPVVNSPSGDATMPLAFRNNTNGAVAHVDLTATVSIGGKIIATGSSQGTDPAQIQPGQVGLAFIYFQTAPTTVNDATYAYTADSSPADTSSFNTADLKVTQANLVNGSMVGSAVNGSTATLTGPYSVAVYCFTGGKLASEHSDAGSVSADLKPGGTTPFSVNLFGTPCTHYEVGVSGYFA